MIGAGEAAVGLLDIPTLGAAGKALEAVGYRPKDAKAAVSDLYSPEQKAANAQVEQAEGFVDTATAMLKNPSTIAHAVGESVPSMLGGGAIAKGLGAATKLGPVARAAIGEGAVGAGSAAESLRQESESGYLDGKDVTAAVGSGATTALLGAAGGRVAQKLGIADVDTALAGGAAGDVPTPSLLRRTAEGALAEGVLEEMPQSMAETAWQNFATERPLGEGVAEAAAAGVLTGGAMGAGFAAINRPTPTQPQTDAPSLQRLPPPGTPTPEAEPGTIQVGPDGTAITEPQAFDQRQRQADFAQQRIDTGLTADVNAARAQHPAAVPNAVPHPNAAPGSLSEVVNSLSPGNGKPVIEGTATRIEPTLTPPPNVDPVTGEVLPWSRDSIKAYLAAQLDRSKPGALPKPAVLAQAFNLKPREAAELRHEVIVEARNAAAAAGTPAAGDGNAPALSLDGGRDPSLGTAVPDHAPGSLGEAAATAAAPSVPAASAAVAANTSTTPDSAPAPAGADAAAQDAPAPLSAQDSAPADLPAGEIQAAPLEDPTATTPGAGSDTAGYDGVNSAVPPTGDSVVAQAAAEAAPSPSNDRPEPTEAQKEAGNYKKGHVRLNGHAIAIENPAGTSRRPEWPPLANHYGYFKGTVGKDKDHVDVFMTDRAEDASLPVFVVDQVDPKTGKFDEHKVIMGAATEAEARATYAANYAPDWTGLKAVTTFTQDEFKAWVKDPAKTVKPAAQAAAAVGADPAFNAPIADEIRPAGKKPAFKKAESVTAELQKRGLNPADYTIEPADGGFIGKRKGMQRDDRGVPKLNEGAEDRTDRDGKRYRVSAPNARGLRAVRPYPADGQTPDLDSSETPATFVSEAEFAERFEGTPPSAPTESKRLQGLKRNLAAAREAGDSKRVAQLEREIARESDDTRVGVAEGFVRVSDAKGTPRIVREADWNGDAETLPVFGLDGAPAMYKPKDSKVLVQMTVAREGATAFRGKPKTSTAPEHVEVETEILGATDADIAKMGQAFNDYRNSKEVQAVTHVFDDPQPGERVDLEKKAEVRSKNIDGVKVYFRDKGWLTVKEARAEVAAWKAKAKAQGADPSIASDNSQRVVLSLFDLTGEWSQPWRDAGYQVYQFDIQDDWTFEHEDPETGEIEVRKAGDINNLDYEFFVEMFGMFEGNDVYAILAANPCTDFTNSGAKHFAAKDADGRTIASYRLVQQTLSIIDFFKPAVWAMENPTGRIGRLNGMPPSRLQFDPFHMGDNYTKDTQIWGRFNADLPVAPVSPNKADGGQGSKMHEKYGGKSIKTKNARSETPEGFAYGFFLANNAHDHPVQALAWQFDQVSRELIQEAHDAGLTPTEIKGAIEDGNYYDGTYDESEAMLREAIAEKREDGQQDELDAEMRSYERKAEAKTSKPTAGDKAAAGDQPGPSQPTTKKAAPTATVTTDKAELRPYRRPDGSVGYQAIPIEAPATVTVSANTVFTEDAAEKARAVLRAKLGQLNTGIDPEIMQAGITLAGYHIEKGARTFAAYAKAMLNDLGETVRPYLKSWYMGVKFDPRATAFEGMDGAAAVEGFDLATLDQPSESADERPDSAADSAQTAAKEPTNADLATDRTAAKPEGVPAGRGRADRRNQSAGRADRKPVDAGLAEAGQGAAGSGDLLAGVDRAGDAGARGAEQQPGDAPGAARADGGVRAESGAADAVSDFDLSGEDIGRGGLATKYRDNVAAIRILKTLDAEGRVATPEERKAIARYVGWGALKGVFDPANKQWAKQHAELKGLLTEAEYKAARASTRNAHFTSKGVVSAMVDGLQRMGFTRGRLLEPSVGVGNFFGLLPAKLRQGAQLHAVELDPLTAKIAAALYPSAKVRNEGFEAYQVPGGYFDAAIGNPPFGEEPIRDMENSPYSGFSIHNYFLAKTIDKLRPGGLAMMVVSHNFLDAKDSRARAWIAERADLVAAVRLPRTAFKGSAGTEVVTDIVVFQRKAESAERNGIGDTAWVAVGTQTLENPKTGEPSQHQVNRYFLAHPEAVLGTPSAAGSMYRANEYTVEPNGELDTQLKAWAATLPAGIHAPIDRTAAMHAAEVPEGVKVGSYFIDKAGQIQRRGDDVAGDRTATPWTAPNAKAGERLRGMIEVRDALRQQMRLERDPDAAESAIEFNRKLLNQRYDAFLKAHGYLNSPTNRRLFVDDTDAPLLQMLEFDYDNGVSKAMAEKEGIEPRGPSATKADIFQRRVFFIQNDMQPVTSAKDAMVNSLNYRGRVDLAYMAGIYPGQDEAAIERELGDLVFRTPDGEVVTADEYLSGDVKTKLAEAEAAAKADPAFTRHVEALRKVIPADKTPSEIHVALGAGFVPGEVLSDFIEHITGATTTMAYVKSLGRWMGSVTGKLDPVRNSQTWGTADVGADAIIRDTIDGRAIVVTRRHKDANGKEYTVVLEAETEAAREKQNAIRAEWKSWLWRDAARAERVLSEYNDKMNRTVARKYDGSHLTLPGKGPGITLMKHQLDGIWRGIQSRQILLDHVVGAGKTFQIVAMVMEMRRLGIARKPLLVVPNHLTLQWRSEFARLYPGANVLAATPDDFSKDMRPKLFAKMVTGDWDAIVIGHSQLKKLGLPPETEARILQEQIDELAESIEQLKRDRGDRNIVRDMEGVKKNLEAKAKERLAKVGERDKVLTFDELGVDALSIDELHEFKNLQYTSTMTKVPGMGNPKGSARGFDLFVKTQWLFETFGEKAPLITATGTPVSNSLVEMFNMQRYMQYPTLKREGLHLFDAWARAYGSIENVYEVSPSGSGFRASSRFAKFQNLGSLMGHYLAFADVVTLDDIKRIQLEQNPDKPFPVPKIEGGKPRLVIAQRSPLVANFMGVPALGRDEQGQATFRYDPAVGSHAIEEKDGKFIATFKAKAEDGHSQHVGTFETREDAQLAIVEAALTPNVVLDEKSVLGRFANLRQLTKETKGKVNALSLTGEANKAGLDYRLIDPAAPDFPGSKLNLAVGNIVEQWKRWKADKGTQLVFCDMSVPLSAKSAFAAKPKPAYVRDSDGGLVRKAATLHAREGAEEIPYLVVVERAKSGDSAGEFGVYDAATGHRMRGPFPSRGEARGWAEQALSNMDGRDTWLQAREASPELDQDAIDEYNDANEVDTDKSPGITLQDIAGVSSKFSVYDDMKAKLIAKGIPEREIAFIHDYDTPAAKAKLFAAVNRGEIRVLFGSTPKMGAGTNVQQRAVALHHIDAPWRPSDLEQREGRVVRQGNRIGFDAQGNAIRPDFAVGIYRYATEQTYDARRWQVLEHKARGIEQLRNYDGTLNEIEDIDGEASNAAEMKAAASGDPLILRETQLRNEVKRLENLEVAHADNVVTARRQAQSAHERATETLPKRLKLLRSLIGDARPAVKEGVPQGSTVEGKAFADRKEFTQAIARAVGGFAKAIADGDSPVAMELQWRGIEFTVEKGWLSGHLQVSAPTERVLDLRVGTEEFSASGLITRMNNYVDRLPADAAATEAGIADAERQADQFLAAAQQPFPEAEAVVAARKDFRKVQRLLLLKGPDLPAADKPRLEAGLARQRAALRAAGLGDTLDELLASKGEDVAPASAPAKVKQTDTPAFKRWFKESKVVGANGEPQMAFHGTPIHANGLGNLEAFDRLAIVKFNNARHRLDTVGSWFSTRADEKGAGMYGNAVYPVFLSIQKPYETTFAALVRQAHTLAGTWNGYDERGERPAKDRPGVTENASAMVGKEQVDALRAWLKQAGHDGIRITHDPNGRSTEFKEQDAWIVLEPEQVKSATANNGEFDPTNPSIMFSRPDSATGFDFEDEFDDSFGLFENNGSGDSSASIEAINRRRDDKAEGRVRALIDRDGSVRALLGVDAVDTHARAGQVIVQRGVGRDRWTVLSQGNDVSRELAAGRLNRAMAELEALGADGEPLFSRPEPGARGPQAKVAELVDLARRARASMQGDAPSIRVVDTARELPAKVRSEAGWESAEGYYDDADGSVYLVAANLRNAAHAAKVLTHEVVGHYGMEAITGPVQWAEIAETVRAMRASGKHDALFAELGRRYVGANEGLFVREAVAVMAEKGVHNSVIDRAVAAMRKFARTLARALGLDLRLSEAELRQMIVKAARHVRQGTRPRGGGLRTAPAFSRAPGAFYSALAESIERGTGAPKRAAASAWKGWLDGAQRRGEFRASERAWLGVDAWLEGRDATTREELAAFVRANEVQVRDVVLDDAAIDKMSDELNLWMGNNLDQDSMDEGDVDFDDVADQLAELAEEYREDGNTAEETRYRRMAGEARRLATGEQPTPAKFKRYTLPGGANYRELLLTLPNRAPVNPVAFQFPTTEAAEDYLGDVSAAGFEELDYHVDPDDRRVVRWAQTPPFRALQLVTEHRGRTIEGETVNNGAYHTSHFPEHANILAHVRFNERTDADGRRVLFLEEIQSDWHQAGRKQGYGSRALSAAEEAEYQSLHANRENLTEAQGDRYDELGARRLGKAGVPDAPFKGTDEWAMLAFKRMVRWAAERGFDRIAWTTGAQQADRFDLSKQVENIVATPRKDATTGEQKRRVAITMRGGTSIVFDVDTAGVVGNVSNHNADLRGKSLDEVVGKEMAEKIMAVEGRHEFTGVDLKVGGNGMRGFYDKILPSAVNKWGKRFGAKVARTSVHSGDKVNDRDQDRMRVELEELARAARDYDYEEFAGEYEAITGFEVTEDAYDDLGDLIRDPTMRRTAIGRFVDAAMDRIGGQQGSVDVHSLDLTDAMRETALAGQPLFSRPDPARVVDAIDAAARGVPEQVAEQARGLWASIKGLKENTRPTWLGALTLRHLAELGRDIGLAHVGNYANRVQQMATDRNVMQEEATQVAEPWEKFQRKDKAGADATANLMHDATIEGVDPAAAYRPLRTGVTARGGDEDVTRESIQRRMDLIARDLANAGSDEATLRLEAEAGRLKDLWAREQARQQAYPGLVARWNALPEAGRQVYIAARDAYLKQSERLEQAILDRIEATGVAGRARQEMITTIRHQFESARIEGPYFPLARFGEFWISATDANGEPFFSLYETVQEWRQAQTDLVKQGMKVTAAGRKIAEARRVAGAGSGFMADVETLLESAGVSAKTRDDVWQLFLRSLPELSMRKHSIHRKKTAGYSRDALRAFAGNMFHGSFQIARVRHTHELEAELLALKKGVEALAKDDPERAAKAAALAGEVNERHEWVMNPKDSKAVSGLTSLGFAWYLGLSPASALVNLSQTAIVTLPVLSARFGVNKSAAALTTGMRRALRNVDGNLTRGLSDEERAAFKVWHDSGAIDKTMAHNLAGLAETDTQSFNPFLRRSMQVISELFHRAELVNREATALAAFRLAREAGDDFATATKYASEVITESHFDYSNANRARFMQSNAAKVLLLFRQYSLNMTWFLWRNFYQSVKGETPQVQKEARTKLAGVLGMTSVFAGVMGLPLMSVGFGLANAAAAAFGGDDEEPWDAEVAFRNFLADMLGPGLARVVSSGAVNAATGANIAGRVSLNDLWLRDPDRELEGQAKAHYLLEQAAGPVIGGMLVSSLRGWNLIEEGQTWRGVETMLPKSLKDGMKSVRYATQGVNTMRGDPIIEDLGVGGALLQLAGFSPASLNERYDANNAAKNYEKGMLDRRAALLDAYAMAWRTEDAETLARTRDKIMEWNAANPELGITMATIRRSLESRMRYSARAEGGVVLDARIAEQARAQARFAE